MLLFHFHLNLCIKYLINISYYMLLTNSSFTKQSNRKLNLTTSAGLVDKESFV